jgi:hypothetical protein
MRIKIDRAEDDAWLNDVPKKFFPKRTVWIAEETEIGDKFGGDTADETSLNIRDD